MKFVPKTEEAIVQEEKERLSALLLADGDYDFEIGAGAEDAVDEVSKSNNDMIHVKLRVYTGQGEGWKFVDDYLLEAMPGKLRHACEATGLLEKYESGNLSADDFKGKCGKVKLTKQKGKAKGDGTLDFYPDKNTVKDYVVSATPATSAFIASQRKREDLDDEIPFALAGLGFVLSLLSMGGLA